MGLTVNVGLRRFMDSDDPYLVTDILETLVRSGYTRLVRNVMEENRASTDAETPAVIEVAMAPERGEPIRRTLPPDEAAPILDGPAPRPRDPVQFREDLRLRLVDLQESLGDWRQKRGEPALVARFHQVAIEHRLIVHSQ